MRVFKASFQRTVSYSVDDKTEDISREVELRMESVT
jgi:hypothetical protein